jgi:hypothetical protein
MKDQGENTASNMPDSGAPPKPVARVSFWYITMLTMLTVGTSSVYHCNQQVIQLSVRRFTTDMRLIGIILALPALIQLLVTPYAAWKSDRIWTRFGRRRPLVMIMAPVLIAALLLLPRCPSLWLFVLVFVVLQIAEDAEGAVMMPSVGDSVPDRQRPLAMGMWQFALSVSGMIMAIYGFRLMAPGLHKVGLPLLRQLGIHGPTVTLAGADHWPYTFTAALIAITSLIYLKVMRERYVPPRPQEKFRLFKYGKEMFQLREHRLIWLITFFQPLFFGVSLSFMSTLGKYGMGLNSGEYGSAYSKFPLVQMVLAAPLGWLFNRYKSRKALCIFACVYAIIPATFGIFYMKTQQDMGIFFGSLVISFMIFRINFTPYLMEYTTPKNIGTVMGFSSLVNGVARTVMMPLMGFLIHFTHNNYRIPMYGLYVSAVVCMMALVMMRSPEAVKHLVEGTELSADLQASPAEA